jgi:hypothetical protein
MRKRFLPQSTRSKSDLSPAALLQLGALEERARSAFLARLAATNLCRPELELTRSTRSSERATVALAGATEGTARPRLGKHGYVQLPLDAPVTSDANLHQLEGK